MPNNTGKDIQNHQYLGDAKESAIEYFVSIKVAIVIKKEHMYIPASPEKSLFPCEMEKVQLLKTTR